MSQAIGIYHIIYAEAGCRIDNAMNAKHLTGYTSPQKTNATQDRIEIIHLQYR